MIELEYQMERKKKKKKEVEPTCIITVIIVLSVIHGLKFRWEALSDNGELGV